MSDTDAAPALLSDGFRSSNVSRSDDYAMLAAWCRHWLIDLPPRDYAALLAGRDHGGSWEELARRLRDESRKGPAHYEARGRKS